MVAVTPIGGAGGIAFVPSGTSADAARATEQTGGGSIALVSLGATLSFATVSR